MKNQETKLNEGVELTANNILADIDEAIRNMMEFVKQKSSSRDKKTVALDNLRAVMYLDGKDYRFRLSDDEKYVIMIDTDWNVVQVFDVTEQTATQILKTVVLENRVI